MKFWKVDSYPKCSGTTDKDSFHELVEITRTEDSRRRYFCSWCGVMVTKTINKNGSSAFYYEEEQ